MPKLFTVAAAAPSVAPTEEGLYWVDTVARKIYFAIGTAAVGDWLEMAIGGAGSSPKFDKILLKNPTDNLYYEVVTETPPDGFGGRDAGMHDNPGSSLMKTKNRKWVSGKVGRWAWVFLLTHTLTGLLTHSAPAATTNWPVQYSTPDYQLLTTNFFRSNLFVGSTNMAITYDARGRPTLWITNTGGGAGTSATNFDAISANSLTVSNSAYLTAITGSSLLRVDGGHLVSAGTIGNGIAWDGTTIAVDGAVTNDMNTRLTDVEQYAADLDVLLGDQIYKLNGATNGLNVDVANLQGATNALNNRFTSNGWLRLQIQSCILPTNNAPALDTGSNYVWRLLFDDTTDETAYWQFVLPDDYGTNATLVCTYSMLVNAANKTNAFQFATQVLRPLVSNNINVSSFADSGGVTNIIPTTIGWATNFAGNLSLSAVAGDLIRLRVNRDADNTMDSATGDAALHDIAIRYTRK